MVSSVSWRQIQEELRRVLVVALGPRYKQVRFEAHHIVPAESEMSLTREDMLW
jgi:hypothetical protein